MVPSCSRRRVRVGAVRRTSRRTAACAAAVLAALAGAACRGGSGSTGAFEAAYRLGESSAASTLEAAEAERTIQSKLTFEAITFNRVSNLDSVPTRTKACGVAYRLSPDHWGIVPDLTFPCGDEEAKARALKDAPARLRTHGDGAGSDHEARLESVRAPAQFMKNEGPALVYARALGVDFDLPSCVDDVAGRLERAAADAAALQCQAFLEPGAALDDYRARLRRAAEQAMGAITVAAGHPPVTLDAAVAARCQADVGAGALSVPGSVSGMLNGGRDAAYAVQLDAGQTIEINLRTSAYDPMLRVHDESCGRALAADDDGGDGNNSRIRWTAPSAGQYVIVASSYQRTGRGPFDVTVSTISTTRMLSEEERSEIRAFNHWVQSATNDDLLAAWRASSASALQLGCLTRARLDSKPIRKTSSAREALSTCLTGLRRATEARKESLAGQK